MYESDCRPTCAARRYEHAECVCAELAEMEAERREPRAVLGRRTTAADYSRSGALGGVR